MCLEIARNINFFLKVLLPRLNFPTANNMRRSPLSLWERLREKEGAHFTIEDVKLWPGMRFSLRS